MLGDPVLRAGRAALRPDRPIRPDVNFLDVAERAGLHHRGRLAEATLAVSLVAHLRGDLHFRGRLRPCSGLRRSLCVSGFCVKQCLPIRMAMSEAAACVWSGVLTVTASMFGRRSLRASCGSR